jgi:hypothetical protein
VSISCIAIIVSGKSEIDALPILMRRVAQRVNYSLVVDGASKLRESEDRLRKPQQLERYVEQSARKLSNRGGVFILLDCDRRDACATRDAPLLLSRAQAVRPQLPMALVLACMEYEAWFLAALRSLRGRCGIVDDAEEVEHPESIRGAKGWLNRQMPRGRPYAETIHQAALTEVFDLDEARRRAPSFDKCYRSIEWLLPRSIIFS